MIYRNDSFYGPGWHVPGGIVRFKETLKQRINKVAINEIGINVKVIGEVVSINEVMSKERDIRGHFISFLYLCVPACKKNFTFEQRHGIPAVNGQLKWFKEVPTDLISQHEMYRGYINENSDVLERLKDGNW